MEEQKEVTSKQWWLDHKDWIKGLIVAALSGPLTIIVESVNAGTFTMDWGTIAKVAITTGGAYILKNFATPSKTITPNK